MRTTVMESRASEKYAANIFETLYSKRDIRMACSRLMANCILTAHHVSSSCWTVTLFSNRIRLNVGPVEVLVLDSDHIFLLIAASDNKYLDKKKYRDFVSESGLHYPGVKIDQRVCSVPPELIEDFYPLIHEDHNELIQLAARTRRKTTWGRSFSPGVIRYLNATLNLSLPMPGYFSDQVESSQINVLQEIEQFRDSYKTLHETTREAVIQSRIGQGQFRASLIEYWQGCSVTGCQQIELLRASHIKPWRDASNAERLDLYNGLLLLPNLDACFEAGLISFDDKGKILISSKLDRSMFSQLGVDRNLELLRVEPKHRDYLRYHRENRFRR